MYINKKVEVSPILGLTSTFLHYFPLIMFPQLTRLIIGYYYER